MASALNPLPGQQCCISHAFYFCARHVWHMGSWEGGRCYCTTAAKQFHLSVRTQTLMQTHPAWAVNVVPLFLSWGEQHPKFPHSRPSIHVGIPSHNSKPYKAGKPRDLCFFPAISCVVWSFAWTNSFVFKHSFDFALILCFSLLLFCFFGCFEWQLFHI